MKHSASNILFLFLLFMAGQTFAQSSIVKIDNHPLHIATWGEQRNISKPTIVLLSGPIDSLFSDSAWWAALAPRLAQTHRVIAIDRAGIVTGEVNAKVGYQHFAKDLHLLLSDLQVQHATVVAFASSNIAIQLYLAQQPESKAIARVILIDPDVLTEFSIKRYQADAEPFRDNLEAYLAYAARGNYVPRVEQKNAADMETLKHLGEGDTKVDWQFVKGMFEARLNINYQLNLFNEMALYGHELEAAGKTSWPQNIPLTIIDTDFELEYAEAETEAASKAGLHDWRRDGSAYYQSVIGDIPNANYIHSKSRAHLFQFAEPQKLLEIIRQFETSTPTVHNK